MTQRTHQLAGLARVINATFSSRQAAMATLKARENSLRAMLEELEAGVKSRHADPNGLLDPARRGGADPLWENWIARRKRELNSELARTMVDQDRVRRDLALAFGRVEATKALIALAKESRAKEQARREEMGR